MDPERQRRGCVEGRVPDRNGHRLGLGCVLDEQLLEAGRDEAVIDARLSE
jgi:hypothetical protein